MAGIVLPVFSLWEVIDAMLRICDVVAWRENWEIRDDFLIRENMVEFTYVR